MLLAKIFIYTRITLNINQIDHVVNISALKKTKIRVNFIYFLVYILKRNLKNLKKSSSLPCADFISPTTFAIFLRPDVNPENVDIKICNINSNFRPSLSLGTGGGVRTYCDSHHLHYYFTLFNMKIESLRPRMVNVSPDGLNEKSECLVSEEKIIFFGISFL